MLLYLDTSALVKLYVNEVDSESVHAALANAAHAATSALAYVEARAALARAHRLKVFSASELSRAKAGLEHDWASWVVVEPTESILRRAADLAEGLGLRGYNSVHLASADYARSLANISSFGAFDQELNRAAKLLGMNLAF